MTTSLHPQLPSPRYRPLALGLALSLAACGTADSLGTSDGGFDNPRNLSCLNMVPLWQRSTSPSVIGVLYRIETCAGDTVQLAPGDGESVFDYYELRENDQDLSSEAVPAVTLSAGQRAYVSLLLDLSSSTNTVKPELLASAREFAQALIASSDKIFVGIRVFAGDATPATAALPTRDLVFLGQVLDQLANTNGGLTDTGSTNLYGAFVRGVNDLRDYQGVVIAENGGGVVTSGYAVVFTDGRDTAGLELLSSARATVQNARTIVSGIDGNLEGNVQTYAVALQGADYTPEARERLIEVIGGDTRNLYEGSLDEIQAQFRSLAARIGAQASSTHLLTYCSAARSGARTVTLRPVRSRGGSDADSTFIEFSFSATGFGGGCAEYLSSVCDGRECGGFNCGACDDATEVCETASGVCQAR